MKNVIGLEYKKYIEKAAGVCIVISILSFWLLLMQRTRIDCT